MKAKEFIYEQILDEVAMTPNALHKLVAGINAKAGMEFEMYVKNISSPDNDYDVEMENDYSSDYRPRSIDDIVSFFSLDDINDYRSIDTLRKQLSDDYNDWRDTEFNNLWSANAVDMIREYIQGSSDWDREDEILIALEEMNLTDKEVAAALVAAKENTKTRGSADKTAYGHWLDAFAIVNEKLDSQARAAYDDMGRIYNKVFEAEIEAADFDEREWISGRGWDSMYDIQLEFSTGTEWPIHTAVDPVMEVDMTDLAAEFEQMIGRGVNTSSSYHGAVRNPTKYCLEPDSSLSDSTDANDAGVEFISPPLPLHDMLSDLKKVKAWASIAGCYTNSTTGLHINVSVPGISDSTLDYVKLALLLGDTHVLAQFNRECNSYCKSSVEEIKTRIRKNPENVQELLNKMREGIDNIASKIIHSGTTTKHVSINNNGAYIEFRAPGGNWLGSNFNKIENTLLRAVVALDAACDPNKYRQEYLKKLYAILAPANNNDPLALFARYASGSLPKSALKSFLKHANLQRKADTTPVKSLLPDRTVEPSMPK